MDSPAVTRIFQQLFARPSRRCLHTANAARRCARPSIGQYRPYSARRSDTLRDGGSSWQQRIDAFPKDMSRQLKEYPRVTARDLQHRTQRPRRVKMYTREFIEDSLYNPNYGYFTKHATIFNASQPFHFPSIKDGSEFNRLVDQSYIDFEDALDAIHEDELRQLWHTPTELFRPYYGEAIARYLVTNYKMTLFPYHDLIIYELGAGNGTLMRNILDWIFENEPEVYERTKFKIIEISKSLADLQMTSLDRSPYAELHRDQTQIIHRSIFDWNEYVHSPCFILALEVIDNFPHDSIRYDPDTEEPLQGSVLINEDGEFFEFYDRNLDPVAQRYLRIREVAARSPFVTPVSQPKFLRQLRHSLPLAPNLTKPEYIPTRLMEFFDVLHKYFPAHRLVLSDFDYLPDAVAGINAPVVQTRYQRRNVQVTTPYVQQGYFDIFFPTDFAMMEDIYRAITGKLTRVSSHKSFMESWAYVEETQVRNGENPMLSWYANASMMTTV
ncbi:ubiquitin-protein ligase E3 C [Exophiala viscosa]|uniref:Protein arginine methyltransferase NDUFAF7 n=1 Tax=Exophiala viscosa TaxID=2486360 RepID=A0AAN6III8_9EURO|nr:ubiquitin-protein ligase E3 C [Exophiala viscosa]